MTIEDPLWLQGTAGSPAYSAREFRLLPAQLWDEGAMDLTAFKVTQRAAGANFSVDVSVGVAVVTGDDQANQGNYLVRSTAIENVVIGAAPGSNSRYDIVCLRINDPNAGGSAGNTATLVVTAGTPAASPTVPATPASSLLLAIIGPIATATASITTSLIHDAQTGTGPAGAAAAHLQAGRRDSAGIIQDFAGAPGSVPNGWLLCDGSSQLRATYPRLFATIGTTYGAVDGTHFTLPDLRGRVGVGLDNMGGSDATRLSVANTLGGSGGTETHTLTAAELASHVHNVNPPNTGVSITDPGHVHDNTGNGFLANNNGAMPGTVIQEGGGGNVAFFANTSPAATGITASVDITAFDSAGNAGAGGAHNNMQPYLLVNKIIRS